MAKYRKKPVVIEAEQFFADKKPWPEGVTPTTSGQVPGFCMETLEGWMTVSEGDWIITGVKDEKYPCKPDIFEMTYDLVEKGQASKASS